MVIGYFEQHLAGVHYFPEAHFGVKDFDGDFIHFADSVD
jgi:hypothetical protein